MEVSSRSAQQNFYVENTCCASCGIPQVVAPDLVGWRDDGGPLDCRWIKQPSTEEELQQAFAIFDSQELGRHRYRGTDPKIQARIGSQHCDNPPSLVREIFNKLTQRG